MINFENYGVKALDESVPAILRSLYGIMEEKKSNLCVAADVITSTDLLSLIHQVGPHIAVLKTHIDWIVDFTPELTKVLTDLAKRYNFLIFEDRKFADIGNTVLHQYRDGVYHIASWAHIINCHPLPGPGILKGLNQVGLELGRGCLLISDMSSGGWLGTDEYKKSALEMALEYPQFVIGWISGSKWANNLPGVVMTPGISLSSSNDSLGQQYKSPEKAILENGSDIIIVGRSIIESDDPQKAATLYQEEGWKAYEQRQHVLNKTSYM